MSVDIKGARRVAGALYNWAHRQHDDLPISIHVEALMEQLNGYFDAMEEEQRGEDEYSDSAPTI